MGSIMQKCDKIGQYLINSDYFYDEVDHYGVTSIYCNIDGKMKTVGSINSSVVEKKDMAKICLKCDNLNEAIKNESFCKNPDLSKKFIYYSDWSGIEVTCKHFNNIMWGTPREGECHKKTGAARCNPRQLIKEICANCCLNQALR